MADQKTEKESIGYQLVNIDNSHYDQDVELGGDTNRETINEEEEESQSQTIVIKRQYDEQNEGLNAQKSSYKRCKQALVKQSSSISAVISIILSILVFKFYFSLKQTCPYDSDHTCLKEFILPNLGNWISIVIFNSTATMVQLHFLMNGSTSRILSAYGFLQSEYFFLFNDNTINVHYYMGGINAIHQIIFVVLLIIYVIIFLWVFCYQKSKIVCFAGNLFFIALIALVFYNRSILHGCDYWTKGINGELENKAGMCQVPIPSLCWYKITHYWQDISLLLPTCENSSTSSSAKEQIDLFFNSAVADNRYIGFANLNTFDENSRMDDNIQKTVFSASKGYYSIKGAQNDKIDVVFDRQEQKYHIDVQFNETLSEERKKISEQGEQKSLAKNILLIFVDAVSRQSMHLKMPKTMKWFEKTTKQHSYDKTNKSNQQQTNNDTQSFEFYKYNSLKPYTYDNLQTLFYGQYVREKNHANSTVNDNNNSKQGQGIEKDDGQIQRKLMQPITTEFQERGYVTAHTSDQCQTLSLGFDQETIRIMESAKYDHETQSFACDPNFQDPKSTFGLFQGPYSITRRCLYGKTMADYPLEYAKSFFTKYQDNKKFMHLEFTYGHEGTGEVINYLDDPLSNFLEEMTNQGLLKDTVVILLNDHGLHMQGIFYLLNLQNVFIEINLPGLFISLPSEINEKYGDQIAYNQQNLVSIMNVHHFIKHLIVGDSYSNKNLSLMNPLDSQKQCSDVGISKDDCSCL